MIFASLFSSWTKRKSWRSSGRIVSAWFRSTTIFVLLWRWVSDLPRARYSFGQALGVEFETNRPPLKSDASIFGKHRLVRPDLPEFCLTCPVRLAGRRAGPGATRECGRVHGGLPQARRLHVIGA